MSLTYSEIYTTNLRAQSNILNGEKTQSPSKQKYITLIKKFSKKQKAKKYKPRRIISKSVQIMKPSKSAKPKGKTKSKIKLENSKKQKEFRGGYKIDNYISKSTDFKTDLNNVKSGFSQRNNYNKDINKIKSDINNNEINSNYFIYNTLQNSNNYNNYLKLSKTYNNNYINKYFDIFRLRQNAAKFRDKNSYLNLFQSHDLENNKQYLNSTRHNNSTLKKSRTYFKANQLREEIEKTLDKNDLYYSSFSNFNLKNNNQNNIINEIPETNEKKENDINNNIEKNNNNDDDNDNDNDNDNNNLKDITYHFFDKNMKMPKRIKKYINSSTSNHMTCKDNLSNQSNYNDTKEKIKPNSFRKQSNISSNNNKLKYNFNQCSLENNLSNDYNSDLYKTIYKTEIKKNKLNLITQTNLKLEKLLRKIPTTRKFRNKSYDLMEYIFKLRKYKNKNILLNNTDNINNNKYEIYPPNECGAFINSKRNIIFDSNIE